MDLTPLNYHYYGHIPKKPCEKMYFEAGLRLPSLHQGPSLGKRRGLRETGKESCCLPTAPAFPRVGGWDFCKTKPSYCFHPISNFKYLPSSPPMHYMTLATAVTTWFLQFILEVVCDCRLPVSRCMLKLKMFHVPCRKLYGSSM